ncbi:FtsX-like permease family protein [Jiangella sp. DSM 45060]|uniref:FtsX-like permease family protein n=1 Tax=Jiangella sp. DSM 45060 TaxID=1798224 RepID=UPI000879ACD5|nr:FtsX-like permease family protein [Jiangella sp. DSM 45060]SDS03141.1 FtsX-like permease family protein [Jiangella sp. DSM 45060]
MTAAWLRLELRRRWRSLLVLALLVALAAGTVLTAVAGARRDASAVDRLLERTLPADVAVLPNQPGFDWDAVRALPGVAAVGTYTGIDYDVDGEPSAGLLGDDETMRTVERPAVLDGRLPDPERPDEAVVTSDHSAEVGDTVTLRLHPADSAAAQPELTVTVVGVVRSYWYHDDAEGVGELVPSPELYAAFEDQLIGDEPGEFNAIVRLHDREAGIPAFQARLREISGVDIDVVNLAELARRDRDDAAFEADALLVFALVAAVASVVLLGLAVARYVAAVRPALRVLGALGLTPRRLAWAAAAGPALAAVVGALLGVAASVVASRWFPIGAAARFDPAPGVAVDLPVLAAGAVAAPALMLLGTIAVARAALRRTGARPARSAVAAAAQRLGAPVPVVVGSRFALEARSSGAVRPALAGAVAGVLGVVAAVTFSAGVRDATTHTERFGQVHQLVAFTGFSGIEVAPVAQLAPMVAADPDVRAVNDTRMAVAGAGDASMSLFTLEPGWRPVVTEGRAPRGAGEVALAPHSAAAVGAAVGDVIRLTGTRGEREVTVTGLAFVPEAPHNDYTLGGWVTPAGYDELFDPAATASPPFKFRLLLVALTAGADPGLVADRLATATATDGLIQPAEPPSRLAELREIQGLPVFLAAFLAAMALGAVGHALLTTVHRRRHDLAVLRAVGLTRRQSRAVLMTQANVLALAGLLFGVPLGIATGRVVWRFVAETTPVDHVAPAALLTTGLVAAAALLAANLLAAWPARRAASLRVGSVLRAE